MVYKLEMQQFEDATLVGLWLQQVDESQIEQALEALKPLSPQRAAIDRLIAGCLKAAPDASAAPIELIPEDMRVMPIVMVAEAIAVMVKVNLDFFLETLPKLAEISTVANRIGSALHSSSLAPAMT